MKKFLVCVVVMCVAGCGVPMSEVNNRNVHVDEMLNRTVTILGKVTNEVTDNREMIVKLIGICETQQESINLLTAKLAEQ